MRDYTRELMPKNERRINGPVLLVLLSLLLWLVGGAIAVFAQTSESTSISGAISDVDVTTGAAAGVVINNTGQKAGKDGRVYAEVSSAPSLGGLALGGGHPCAYSPATAQISIIGGGAGIGGSKVDSACMLMVMGAAGDEKAYRAAQLMLAARDPAACIAMEAAGLVAGCKQPRRGVTTASAKTVSGWGAKCEKVGNKITFRPTSAAAREAELSACKARF
jgi:hypothetical protein